MASQRSFGSVLKCHWIVLASFKASANNNKSAHQSSSGLCVVLMLKKRRAFTWAAFDYYGRTISTPARFITRLSSRMLWDNFQLNSFSKHTKARQPIQPRIASLWRRTGELLMYMLFMCAITFYSFSVSAGYHIIKETIKVGPTRVQFSVHLKFLLLMK